MFRLTHAETYFDVNRDNETTGLTIQLADVVCYLVGFKAYQAVKDYAGNVVSSH